MTLETIPTMASVLTPFPYHIDSNAPIGDAKKLMSEHDIRHLIVMDDGDIYGLVSDREIQHHSALYGVDKNSNLTVNDICINRIVMADIHDPLDKVLEVMAEKRLGSVVVLREGELAGIFTTVDACYHFAHFLQKVCKHNDLPDIVA
jgi:acetoin utilization protein AcuB